MPRKHPPLVDELKHAVGTRRGPRRWSDHLSPEDAAELNAIRDAFHRGEFGSVTLNEIAGALSDLINKRRISNVGRQGVIRWLANR
jgi:hypothetical protein